MSKTAKLTKTQQKVIDEAKASIEDARTKSFEDWVYSTTREVVEELPERWVSAFRRDYDGLREGVAIVKASSNTLRALEAKGIIEIVSDGGRNIDYIKLV
jgi:hypothetical protein